MTLRRYRDPLALSAAGAGVGARSGMTAVGRVRLRIVAARHPASSMLVARASAETREGSPMSPFPRSWEMWLAALDDFRNWLVTAA